MFQTATRSDAALERPGGQDRSIGGALGAEAGFSGFDFVASGYYGEGLGMISVQDGDEFGSSSTDAAGQDRNQYGFLLQGTYKLTSDIKLGINYGQTCQEKSTADKNGTGLETITIPMLKQEAAVGMITYNLNKFTQFIAEIDYAQNTWMDGAKQHSNGFDVGTMFYW
jgi:hypothetical protein